MEKLAFVFGSAHVSSFTQAVCRISTSFSDCFQVQWIHEDPTSDTMINSHAQHLYDVQIYISY